MSDAPITLDELLRKELHLVTYEPRYSHHAGFKVGVFIAGNLTALAAMADAMTDGGDYCSHIENMLNGTPYFPWGEGITFQEAVDAALTRVNQFSRTQWFNAAYYEVHNAPSAYAEIRKNYKEWPPLPSIEEAIEIWKNIKW